MNCVSVCVPRTRVPDFFSPLVSILATQKTLRINRLQYRRVGVLALFAVLVFSPLTVRAGMIFSADFENGTFGNVSVRKVKLGAGYPSLCCKHSAQIVTAPGRSGSKAVKFTLRSTDAGYEYGKWKNPMVRAELEKPRTHSPGDTRWHGFSVYIDPSWHDSTKDPNGTIIAQWHGMADPGEKSLAPHLAIQVTKDNRWLIRKHSDANRISITTAPNRITWNVGTVEKGQWVDWVVFAKWSYKSDGILKVWKNGQLVVNYNGPNTYNDVKPQFFKFGIYKAQWKSDKPVPPYAANRNASLPCRAAAWAIC